MKRTPVAEQTVYCPSEWNTVPDLPPVGRRVQLDRYFGALYKVCLDDTWYMLKFYSDQHMIYCYNTTNKLVTKSPTLTGIKAQLEQIHGKLELPPEPSPVQVAIDDLPF